MDCSQKYRRRSEHPNLVLAREVEEVEVLDVLPCSEMNLPHPEEEVQMVEVEEEPKMKTLARAQTQRTWAHIG
jgi:hypothetical protein